MKTHRSVAASLLFISISVGRAWGASRPLEVRLGSPAGPGIAAVFSACPTFTWSASPEAEGYRLVVYDARDGSAADRSSPIFGIELAAGFAAYQHCLEPGDRYGWAVAAIVDGIEHWSEPAVFEVLGPHARQSKTWRPVASASKAGPARSPLHEPSSAPSFDATLAGTAAPRSLSGASFSPSTCTGAVFDDVDASNPFCPWIEQLGRDRIEDPEVGCGDGNYCPKAPVTSEQAALLLERSMRGTDTFRPGSTTADIPNRPPAATTFTDLASMGSPGGGNTSITIGADGLGLISYYGYQSFGSGSLSVAHCSNADCSAATLKVRDTGGQGPKVNAITVGADGLGLTGSNNDFAGFRVGHCSDADCTYGTLYTIDSSRAAHASITIAADGRGLISYYVETLKDLKVAHCSDVDCSAATLTSLDTAGDVGQYPSITTGVDGLGLISYYDATNGDLKVAHCSNVNCSAASSAPLDTTGDVGQYTSITIGADGRGLISYYDTTNGYLKVAHCSNVSCSSGTILYRDIAGNVGQHTSITVGADGRGVISYYDATTKDLKLAHCSNVDCSSATLTSLDTADDVGQYTSITIGADGLPLISYYDATHGYLVVAHCSNAFCAPFFRRR